MVGARGGNLDGGQMVRPCSEKERGVQKVDRRSYSRIRVEKSLHGRLAYLAIDYVPDKASILYSCGVGFCWIIMIVLK